MRDVEVQKNSCCVEDIAAYLDGEMNGDELSRFELHICECKRCVGEIENQKRLLNALDFALDVEKKGLELPKNFTKVVAKTAESNMRGVRQYSERKKALRISVALALLSFVLLGGASLSESIISPVQRVFKVAGSISEMIGRVIYDAGLGVVVIVRAVSRHFIFDSNALNLFFFCLFMFALFFLSRLILRHRRA
jgi:hypothetical protein